MPEICNLMAKSLDFMANHAKRLDSYLKGVQESRLDGSVAILPQCSTNVCSPGKRTLSDLHEKVLVDLI